MPRRARLDAAGALHHIMVRGINKSAIFEDDQDRGRFLERLGTTGSETKCSVYAWALMTNHVHALPHLTGGGLVRSLGGWAQVQSAQQSGRKTEYDERILGSGEFVDAVFREIEEKQARQFRLRKSGLTIARIIEEECAKGRIGAAELQSGSKRIAVRKARAKIARRGVEDLGLPAAEIARHVGVCTSTITRALAGKETSHDAD